MKVWIVCIRHKKGTRCPVKVFSTEKLASDFTKSDPYSLEKDSIYDIEDYWVEDKL